ncbi:hypothetical protein [Roseovarius nanhaiticus]|uniref:hypothetical protein n=1 Tax=Roseovarius nanhaiticus TaxID=573024 RepID=UPI0024928ABE|nr:hypothetical protein [Roseovarius nanhaiticus]
MTYACSTMPLAATESPSAGAPATIPMLFAPLNIALATAIAAERDLGHANVFDISIDHWLREAEMSWDAVTDCLRDLRGADAGRLEDAQLMAMADLVSDVMGCEEIGAFVDAQRAVRAARYRLRCPGLGPGALQATQLLRQCHAHLSAMIRMDVFTPAFDPDALPDGTQVWPEAC